jgi:hypothetical protein
MRAVNRQIVFPDWDAGALVSKNGATVRTHPVAGCAIGGRWMGFPVVALSATWARQFWRQIGSPDHGRQA